MDRWPSGMAHTWGSGSSNPPECGGRGDVTDFGNLDLRLDPWEGEYGAALRADDAVAEEDCSVDLTAEIEGTWAPITPAGVFSDRPVAFIDGVRRVDARVVALTDEGIVHGAFGTYGVGVVESHGSRAVVSQMRTERVLVLGKGLTVPEVVEVHPSLVYRPMSTSKEQQEAPARVVHDQMRHAEAQLAIELAERLGDALIITDGPIHELVMPGRAVGYIKRIFRLYLPPSHLGVLAALGAGTRTPIFCLQQERFRRYAWFARLVDPAPTDSPLAGLVRMEVPDSVGIEQARQLADFATARAPEFVADRARDARAPQNLLPISALETQLRHAMGDPSLVRRMIEDHIVRGIRANAVAKEDANVE